MLKYALVFFVTCPAFASERLRFEDRDKQVHFLASYSLNTTLLAALPNETKYEKLKAAGVTVAVGVAKEFLDPEFSGADLAADGIGILVSTLFAYTFDF